MSTTEVESRRHSHTKFVFLAVRLAADRKKALSELRDKADESN